MCWQFGGMSSAKSVLLVLLVTAFCLWLPAPAARAHAALVDAEPSAGTGLPQAPADVVIRFTEPLVPGPSRIAVLDEQGRDVAENTTRIVGEDRRTMRRELGLLPPGQYEVQWATLSPIDGHTLRGSYFFAVGSRASSDAAVAAGPLDSNGVLGLVGRFVALFALTLWVGVLLLSRRAAALGIGESLVRLGRILPGAVAVGNSAALAGVATTAGVAAVPALLQTPSGLLRLAVILAATAAAITGRDGERRRHLAMTLAAVAVVAQASSGHAAASPQPIVASMSFAVHVGAVGVWLGAIVIALLPPTRLRASLPVLAPAAIRAAIVAGATGVLSASFVISGFGDFASTAYGRTLTFKTLAVAVMVLVGARHGAIRTRASDPHVRALVRVEFMAGIAALILTATLASFASPPREETRASSYAEGDPVLRSLVQRDAISLARASGNSVIGLTVLPPRPGLVDLRVQVEGTKVDAGVQTATVTARGPRGRRVVVPLKHCGRDCFAGPATLPTPGLWQFDISLETNGGPVAVTVGAPLPARQAKERLEDAVAAMERIDSARVVEVLRETTDGRRYVSDYTFQAPDSMRWLVHGLSGRIAIGDQGWKRTDPQSPWRPFDWAGDGFVWPDGFYSQFFRNSAAVRELGNDSVDGRSATIISFVQPSFPIWYRLWIDDETHRVLRLEMRTEDHLMDQRYSHFDDPVSITPPLNVRE